VNNYFAKNQKGGKNFIGGNLFDFFNKSNVLVNNKYYVILYGEHIDNCYNELKKSDPQRVILYDSDGFSLNENTGYKSVAGSVDTSVDGDGFFVSMMQGKYAFILKWSCQDITIPKQSLDIENSVNMDFHSNGGDYYAKNIQHGEIQMTVIDNENMALTHIFKTLFSLYNTSSYNDTHALMKTRSAFRKMHMLTFSTGGLKVAKEVGDNLGSNAFYKEAMLNYNNYQNIIMNDLNFNKMSYSENKIDTFTVSFKCPVVSQKKDTVTLSHTELIKMMNDVYYNNINKLYGLEAATDKSFYKNATIGGDERFFYEYNN
jgi:hypothetical protein